MQSETLPKPTLESKSIPLLLDWTLAHRENQIRNLLDDPYGMLRVGNYEYASKSGLLDEFYYDPETGSDGVIHILSGEAASDENGTVIPIGFHHEPSAKFGPLDPTQTFVDNSRISNTAKARKSFSQQPFEPYKAHVRIGGFKKMGRVIDPETGSATLSEIANGMFPKEYDGLAVLKAVSIARNNLSVSTQAIITQQGDKIVEGYAPMIDGKSLMRIRMLIDKSTGTIKTAYPIVKSGGIMKLSEILVNQCLSSPTDITVNNSKLV